MINPCEGCVIQPICEKMCPEVIAYYKGQVKHRTKLEIEDATGYHWHEDPDGHEFFSGSSAYKKPVKEIPKEEPRIEPTKAVWRFFEKLTKGMKLCLTLKNKNTLKD